MKITQLLHAGNLYTWYKLELDYKLSCTLIVNHVKKHHLHVCTTDRWAILTDITMSESCLALINFLVISKCVQGFYCWKLWSINWHFREIACDLVLDHIEGYPSANSAVWMTGIYTTKLLCDEILQIGWFKSSFFSCSFCIFLSQCTFFS